MENAIHVGNKIDKETATNLASIISVIFEKGRQYSMDQSTIVAAIEMIQNVSEVKNVSIAGSTFTGDRIINIPE